MASKTLLKILFVVFSMIIAREDIKTGAVPRIMFIIAFPFFVILKTLLYEKNMLPESIAGGFIGFIVFFLSYFLSNRSLGLADVWYSMLIGLIMGPWRWYAAIGISCVAGAICILAGKKRQIPFIPYLAFGSIAIIFIGGFCNEEEKYFISFIDSLF